MPTLLDEHSFEMGDLVAVLWGVRFIGDSFWGDIALLDPICDGCGDIYEVIPMGIPLPIPKTCIRRKRKIAITGAPSPRFAKNWKAWITKARKTCSAPSPSPPMKLPS